MPLSVASTHIYVHNRNLVKLQMLAPVPLFADGVCARCCIVGTKSWLKLCKLPEIAQNTKWIVFRLRYDASLSQPTMWYVSARGAGATADVTLICMCSFRIAMYILYIHWLLHMHVVQLRSVNVSAVDVSLNSNENRYEMICSRWNCTLGIGTTNSNATSPALICSHTVDYGVHCILFGCFAIAQPIHFSGFTEIV